MSVSDGVNAIRGFASGDPNRTADRAEVRSSLEDISLQHRAFDESALLVAAKLRKQLGDGPTVLVLTSLTAREGVSAATAELARVLSTTKGAEPILVVDANLNSPSQHERFGVSPEPGLIQVLSGESTVSEAVHPTRSESLYVLPAGADDSLDRGFLNARTAAYLEVLGVVRSQFHTILIDAPSLMDRGVSAFVASQSDGVMMLVTARRHERGRLKKALGELESFGAKVLGVCLTETGEALPGLSERLRASAQSVGRWMTRHDPR